MGKGVEEIKKIISNAFPKLQTDANFDVTSKQTPNYNCLAWANNYNDRWMQPFEPMVKLDGVVYFWPPGAKRGPEVECLIDAYEILGFEMSINGDHEDGYLKIAIYSYTNGFWSHAARELRNGFWASKLGPEQDIQHGTPYTIEGIAYGNVHCFMKKKSY